MLSERPIAERATENIKPQAALFLRETVLTYEIGGLMRRLRGPRRVGTPGKAVFPAAIEQHLDAVAAGPDMVQLILPLRLVPKDTHIGVVRVTSPHHRVSILGNFSAALLQERLLKRVLRRLQDAVAESPASNADLSANLDEALAAKDPAGRQEALDKLAARRGWADESLDDSLRAELRGLHTLHTGQLLWACVELPAQVAFSGSFELEATLVVPPPVLGKGKGKDAGKDAGGLAIALDWPQYARSYHVTCRPNSGYFVSEFEVIERAGASERIACRGGPAREASCYWPPFAGTLPIKLRLRSAARPPSASGQLGSFSLGMAAVQTFLAPLIVFYGPGSLRVSVDLAAATVLVTALFAAWWALRPTVDVAGWTDHETLAWWQPRVLAGLTGVFWIATIAHIVATPSPTSGDTGLPFVTAALHGDLGVTAAATTTTLIGFTALSVLYLVLTAIELIRRDRTAKGLWRQASEQPQPCLTPTLPRPAPTPNQAKEV